MSDWDSPKDLEAGDYLEIYGIGRGRVSSLFLGNAYIVMDDGYQYSLDYVTPRFGVVWKRIDRATIPTLRVAEVAYGVKCTKCDGWYEYAERVAGFVCTPCKTVI